MTSDIILAAIAGALSGAAVNMLYQSRRRVIVPDVVRTRRVPGGYLVACDDEPVRVFILDHCARDIAHTVTTTLSDGERR